MPRSRLGATLPFASRTVSAEPSALMRLQLKRVPRAGSRITLEVAEMIVNRVMAVTLDALSATGATVRVERDKELPVIEASFAGPAGPMVAAGTAVQLVQAVRRVQRAAENEFLVSGGLAVGAYAEAGDGFEPSERAEEVLARLFERAGPGQILLSEEARAFAEPVIETTPLLPRAGESERFHVLRDLR